MRSSESIEDLCVIDEKAGPEKIAMAASGRNQLLQNIRGLPLPLRQVITLALEDMPNGEIAAVLGISENNVAVRLSRARATLRERMESK